MPFGNAQSLTNDELYATAYVLYLNDVITDEKLELNERNFTLDKAPQRAEFPRRRSRGRGTRVLGLLPVCPIAFPRCGHRSRARQST